MMDSMILRFLPKLAKDPSCQLLSEAWKEGDRKKMFEALHAMKGVCGNLGLASLVELVSGALEPIRPGSTLTISDEELGEKVAAIQKQYEWTVAKIEEIE